MENCVEILKAAVKKSTLINFYLKKKVKENNKYLRLKMIHKASRFITELLPFENKSIRILDDPSLLKYLFLTYDLAGQSVIFLNRKKNFFLFKNYLIFK